MSLRMTRLGAGECLLGLSGTVLLVDLFAVSWFVPRSAVQPLPGLSHRTTGVTGWYAFSALGPVTLLVCVAALVILVSTVVRRSPALPVVMTTLLLPVSVLQTLALLIRVLVDRPPAGLIHGLPGAVQTSAGAFVGVGLSGWICAGAYLTLRRESSDSRYAPSAVETVDLRESPSPKPA